jgi:hypothetical protein
VTTWESLLLYVLSSDSFLLDVHVLDKSFAWLSKGLAKVPIKVFESRDAWHAVTRMSTIDIQS